MNTKTPPFQRLPLLKADSSPAMVVHRSLLNEFLLKKKEEDKNKSAKDYSITDLVKAHPFLKEKSFVTIPSRVSAAYAKEELEKVKECSDVLITTDGGRKSAVVRWITNVDILQAAQI